MDRFVRAIWVRQVHTRISVLMHTDLRAIRGPAADTATLKRPLLDRLSLGPIAEDAFRGSATTFQIRIHSRTGSARIAPENPEHLSPRTPGVNRRHLYVEADRARRNALRELVGVGALIHARRPVVASDLAYCAKRERVERSAERIDEGLHRRLMRTKTECTDQPTRIGPVDGVLNDIAIEVGVAAVEANGVL
jgi:hypothetical protein